MNYIYYSEVNIICILVLLVFQKQLKEKHFDIAMDKVIFNWILRMNIVFCVSDMVAGIFRGQMFSGARIIVEISNLIY